DRRHTLLRTAAPPGIRPRPAGECLDGLFLPPPFALLLLERFTAFLSASALDARLGSPARPGKRSLVTGGARALGPHLSDDPDVCRILRRRSLPFRAHAGLRAAGCGSAPVSGHGDLCARRGLTMDAVITRAEGRRGREEVRALLLRSAVLAFEEQR